MESYRERILKSIGCSDVGLTTVDVAKKAGVSKTTVIKYLSVLSSEGNVEFVEVGPSKLWRTKETGIRHGEERDERAEPIQTEALPAFDIDFSSGEDKRLSFIFRVDSERVCALMRRANRCGHEKSGGDIPIEG